MNESKFELLDDYFAARRIKPAHTPAIEERTRRVLRLWRRLEGLASAVFAEFEDYLGARLGDAVECYVDRHAGLDGDAPPHVSFRWGVQGGHLNSLTFTGQAETGEIRATWNCWRKGLRFQGDRAIDPSWTPQTVHAMLEELVFQFAPI
jgi:hypothetical protein